MKPIEIQGETPISVTDYEAKANWVIEELGDTVFKGITPEDCFDISYDKMGNMIKKKRSTKKNELCPTITPTAIAYKLNELLRCIMPMDKETAKMLPPSKYLEAYKNYNAIMQYINSYIVFIDNKQFLSAFLGVTVSTFNDLCSDSSTAYLMEWFDDGTNGISFVAGESGLSDSRAVISRLQTRGAGQNLRKTDENITLFQQTNIDKMLVDARIDGFLSDVAKAQQKQIGGK